MFKSIIKYFMERFPIFDDFIQNILCLIKKIRILLYKNKHITDREMLHLLTVAKIHNKTFSRYKNCNYGKDIVLIATGPSLNKYIPLKNVINIGVNKAFLCDKVSLDYLFMQDYIAIKSFINKLDDTKYSKIDKFFGIAPETYFDDKNISLKQCIIPEQLVIKYNAKEYFQYCKSFLPIKFYKDIDSNYIECGGSVVFAAMQFALYTNPRRIYIVGCDCTWGHYDENIDKVRKNRFIINSWKELKSFASINYPETEIISVNPVGLRGVFKDLDQ